MSTVVTLRQSLGLADQGARVAEPALLGAVWSLPLKTGREASRADLESGAVEEAEVSGCSTGMRCGKRGLQGDTQSDGRAGAGASCPGPEPAAHRGRQAGLGS